MMNKKITLVLFGDNIDIEWSYGAQFSLSYDTNGLQEAKNSILEENADYILFWDTQLEFPKEQQLLEIINSKGNLWHIGSKVGTSRLPKTLDSIQPTNMLHLVSDTSLDHSSWKNTFRGCFMEESVFKQIPLANYSNSLDTIGLDFGYKAMRSGVFTRYSFALSKSVQLELKKPPSIIEELSFIQNNFDKKALLWCYAMIPLKVNPFKFLEILKRPNRIKLPVFKHELDLVDIKNEDISVSIVIATLERYACLTDELKELRLLDIPVKEIIIVDQTPREKRNKHFINEFHDLPIVYVETDKIGQCSARNKGIEIATSKFIWFLDDDMAEIPSNYLNKHLKTIYTLDADVSCGIPDEIGTNYIDRSISKIELSNGFPTNDVLVKKELLVAIGLFDEKMDQKQSEDQEIGLRCVKNGALSVKNNELRIVHLRAARGGLRSHNVRKITFSSSRNKLFDRRYLHHSEIYLNLKHFSSAQVKKLILLNLRGTFIVRGGIIKKGIKILIAILLLPYSIYINRINFTLAKKILNQKS